VVGSFNADADRTRQRMARILPRVGDP
jgi:hypothetical protein